MAMPPGGQSSWFHHSDSYHLLGDDDAIWGILTTPLSRDSLTLALSLADDSPNSFLYLVRIEGAVGQVTLTYCHPLLPDRERRTRWTAETPPDELVPHPAILRRTRWGGHIDGAPLFATVHASPGAVTVTDAAGVARVHLRLGSDPDPAWPEAGARGAIAAASFFLPIGPGARVKKLATSLP